MFAVISGALTSCSIAGIKNFFEYFTLVSYREMLDDVLAAIVNDDKEALKSLFSVTASEAMDLDSALDEFFDALTGPVVVEEVGYLTSGGGLRHYGERQTYSRCADDVMISAGGVRYYVRMAVYEEDDFEPNNVGIHALEIATEEAIDSEHFATYLSYDGKHPGFFYQYLTEKRDDVRFIEGSHRDYVPYDRTLTAEDIAAVVRENNDYLNLVSVIGQPNCSWKEYDYYYYELEDGLFAVCKVEDIWDKNPPTTGSTVIEPNVVVAVYIADEKENLETVWMADNIVKISGGYQIFTPADRSFPLTEDYFKSFAERGGNMPQLEEEIGLPNVIDEWHNNYYEIADNRYVECYCNGTNIKSFWVVDSEDRLYAVWEAEEDE